jgi:hypothetical protein
MRVRVPGFVPEVDEDSQSPAIDRLGLGQPVGDAEESGEIVERGRDIRMVRPEARLVGPSLASSIANARRISGSASANQ